MAVGIGNPISPRFFPSLIEHDNLLPKRVDNMEAALLTDERTDLVHTNGLGIPEAGQSASHLLSWLQ